MPSTFSSSFSEASIGVTGRSGRIMLGRSFLFGYTSPLSKYLLKLNSPRFLGEAEVLLCQKKRGSMRAFLVDKFTAHLKMSQRPPSQATGDLILYHDTTSLIPFTDLFFSLHLTCARYQRERL